MAKRREDGWYWVKWFRKFPWSVAQWDGRYFQFCGAPGFYTEEDMSRIGPRIEPPKEKRNASK